MNPNSPLEAMLLLIFLSSLDAVVLDVVTPLSFDVDLLLLFLLLLLPLSNVIFLLSCCRKLFLRLSSLTVTEARCCCTDCCCCCCCCCHLTAVPLVAPLPVFVPAITKGVALAPEISSGKVGLRLYSKAGEALW